MFRLFVIIVIFSGIFAFIGCNDSAGLATESQLPDKPLSKIDQNDPKDNGVVLHFSLYLVPRVYERSDWGEPPQVAIWLEDPDSQTIKTVFVTHRSASGDWKGKVSCPVALPYWFSRYNKEAGTVGPPTYQKPSPHAITGATPPLEITASVNVPPDSKWDYYIEVNVAGDFNRDFPSMLENGRPDPQGNGQPSLIYKGSIRAEPGVKSSPILVGRTDQWRPTGKIIEDITSITTAKKLIDTIDVTSEEPRVGLNQ